jgi:hypothetical protein
MPMPQPREPDRADPWFKFFVKDWQGDELLALCSFAARGFLVELICLMHKSVHYGHLLVNGEPPSDGELARLTHSASPAEVRRLRLELVTKGVISIDFDGVFFSRRMVRQQAKLALARAHGASGGNPSLRTTSGIASGKNAAPTHKAGDNPRVNPPVKGRPNPQIQIQIQKVRTSKVHPLRDDPGTGKVSVLTAASRRRLRNHEKKNGQKVATHRVLCAMARATSSPGLDYSTWAEAVKVRLATQGFAYPAPHALTAALEAVFHVKQSRKA